MDNTNSIAILKLQTVLVSMSSGDVIGYTARFNLPMMGRAKCFHEVIRLSMDSSMDVSGSLRAALQGSGYRKNPTYGF